MSSLSPVSDPAQAPVLRWALLLLHRRQVLGGGEERAAAQRPDPHHAEPLHSVGHDAHGEDHHGEAVLEGQGAHVPALPPPPPRPGPITAQHGRVRALSRSVASATFNCRTCTVFVVCGEWVNLATVNA